MTEAFPAEQAPQEELLKLDLSTPEMTAAFAAASIYAKTGTVRARPAIAGEQITSILANGHKQTTNTAKEGDLVITTPTNENYILAPDIFGSRYAATEEEGVYRATGMVRAFQNPTGRKIEVMAHWGQPQYGNEDYMLATVYDPNNPDWIGDDRYIIGHEEFLNTYTAPEAVQVPAQEAAVA